MDSSTQTCQRGALRRGGRQCLRGDKRVRCDTRGSRNFDSARSLRFVVMGHRVARTTHGFRGLLLGASGLIESLSSMWVIFDCM